MKLLINPDDRAELAVLFPGAEFELDRWKALPRGKYVDLERLERKMAERLTRPLHVPPLSLYTGMRIPAYRFGFLVCAR